MKTVRKNKIYKELLLVWPNVDRMVNAAERYLDKLAVSGSDLPFVEACALEAATKARDIEYTDDYTLQKLKVFCEEFKVCLLGLEGVRITHCSKEWTPGVSPFKDFIDECKKDGIGYTVTNRKQSVENPKYRKMVEEWVNQHV